MRTLDKAVLASTLGIFVLAFSFSAASAVAISAPIGVVLQAEYATIGSTMTLSGETIYNGDHLGTGESGILRASLGGSQMYLRPSTSAKVHPFENGFSAELIGGTVVLSSPEGRTFQLVADGATIRPASPQATTAEIAWVNAKQLALTARRGAVEIRMGDEVKTIEPGTFYRMDIETADPGSQSGPSPAAKNHFIIVAITGVTAGAIIGVWRALVSPSAP